MVGSTAEAAPRAALAVGIVLALLVAVVLEVEGRRRRAAMELYGTEHRVAADPPAQPAARVARSAGLDLAARYVAEGSIRRWGVIWFDVFPIEGGRVGLAIGDVMATTSWRRPTWPRSAPPFVPYAWQGDAPGRVLDQLDRVVTTFALTPLVTVFYGVLDAPGADGAADPALRQRWPSPPVASDSRGFGARPGGWRVGDRRWLLGDQRGQRAAPHRGGSTIVLFTDGLVETLNEGLDDSLAALAERIATQEPSLSVDQLSELGRSRRRPATRTTTWRC